ncbi:hypothetical protein CBR_g24017 [Chara braunii]|uniref:Uncharacterized protein n=1 Tax=Chara braunii TaxID=69332 RepID=A0A388L5I7_CHABU|nr:hypothetical protein CBR_g24017 [Chara braunii]|eukprot:GBG77570.1 hypothetical protein CBR_g24017 [Chara braunii]
MRCGPKARAGGATFSDVEKSPSPKRTRKREGGRILESPTWSECQTILQNPGLPPSGRGEEQRIDEGETADRRIGEELQSTENGEPRRRDEREVGDRRRGEDRRGMWRGDSQRAGGNEGMQRVQEEGGQTSTPNQICDLNLPRRPPMDDTITSQGRTRLGSPEPRRRAVDEDPDEQPAERTAGANQDRKEETRVNARPRMLLLDRAFDDLRRAGRLRLVPLAFRNDLGSLDILIADHEATEMEVRFAMVGFEDHPSQQRAITTARGWVGNNYVITPVSGVSAIRLLERGGDGRVMGLNCFML